MPVMIHRVVFGADAKALKEDFGTWLGQRGLGFTAGNAIAFSGVGSYAIAGAENVLPTVHLQSWLDEYLKAHPECTVDYVHGEEALNSVCAARGAAGIRLGTIEKAALFPSVRLNGVLPRKSFSMGEADEKRFYMEARMIQ